MSAEHLSNRVKLMAVSATIAMSQASRDLKNSGKDVISLSIGEPDFNTPDLIKEAAKKAIDENYSKYPPISGYQDLKEAICKKFKRENNIDYSPSQILVSTGAKQSIANVILALVNEGDEVILPAPYWVSYLELIKLAGGIPIEVNSTLESDFKITAKELEAAISSKTKLIIYSSPCNPTGSVFSKQELSELAMVVKKHEGVYVLADEIYEYINFTDESFSIAALDFIKDRIITVNGVAKGFAMTGWRIGYMGGPEWIVKACDKIQGQFTSAANSIAQRATITAVKNGKNLTTEMKSAFLRRRNFLFDLLSQIPGLKVNKPKGAFYFFPDVSDYFGTTYKEYKINNANDLCLFLLHEGLVACVAGDAFGAKNCIRISYASSDEILVEAASRIKNTLLLLNK